MEHTCKVKQTVVDEIDCIVQRLRVLYQCVCEPVQAKVWITKSIVYKLPRSSTGIASVILYKFLL